MEDGISRLADIIDDALRMVPPISDAPLVEPVELENYDPSKLPLK